MRARTFIVPVLGAPTALMTWLEFGAVGFGEDGFGSFPNVYAPAYRSPDPLPAITLDPAVTGDPPVPSDRLSAPTGDELLPQVLLDAPRGRAWQTDETQAQLGSTVQHGVWGVIADALAVYYVTLTRAVLSAFPSATDETGLASWEADFGLPDACLGDNPSVAARRAAVRAELSLPEVNSRANLISLAAAAGYTIEIDEWEGFEFGASGFGEEGFGHPDLPFTLLVVTDDVEATWLELGAVGFGEEGFGSFPTDGLICLIQRNLQAHIRAVFILNGVVL